MLRPHNGQAHRAVQADPYHFPGNLVFIRGRFHNREGGHLHRDGPAQRCHMPVEVYPLRHHAPNGYSGARGGGGWGRLFTCSIPAPLFITLWQNSDQIWGGTYCIPCLSCPAAAVRLEARPELAAELSHAPLSSLPTLMFHDPVVDNMPGLSRYPRLEGPLLSWWLLDSPRGSPNGPSAYPRAVLINYLCPYVSLPVLQFFTQKMNSDWETEAPNHNWYTA